MFIDVSQRRVLEIFTASLRILMLNFYALFIRRPYYLLLEIFLEKIMIVGSYRRIMIPNIPLEKHRNGRMIMMLINFLGHHRVLT
jgi:hypothetical protein